MSMPCKRRLPLLLTLALAATVPMVQADDRRGGGLRTDGPRAEGPRGDDRRGDDRRGDDRRGDDRRGDDRRNTDRRGDDRRTDGRWWDGAHGHNHAYPPPGRVLPLPPRPPAVVWWGGVDYRFWDGVWATTGPRGWIAVRPPIGIVVHDLPSWRTALVIGGLTYLYVNGVYYRERTEGGYEVVPPPPPRPDPVPPDRSFVYPAQGQSAQQQASDEYECHRWAVSQSGFDPSGVATGQTNTVSTTGRGDYQRARGACLEGRGYTVR